MCVLCSDIISNPIKVSFLQFLIMLRLYVWVVFYIKKNHFLDKRKVFTGKVRNKNIVSKFRVKV
jgi:hypothetical protein